MLLAVVDGLLIACNWVLIAADCMLIVAPRLLKPATCWQHAANCPPQIFSGGGTKSSHAWIGKVSVTTNPDDDSVALDVHFGKESAEKKLSCAPRVYWLCWCSSMAADGTFTTAYLGSPF